jgi:hypothetical protein
MVMAGHYYYFNHEYMDMIKAMGACDGNAHAAEIFQRWRHPDDKVITHVEQWLVDTGHLNPRRGMGGCPLSMSWQKEEKVLDMGADQPGISMRALARRHNLPKTKVHTCLQRYTYTGHSKCRHYSLGTGDIAYSSVDAWWKEKMKMPNSSHMSCGLISLIFLKWAQSIHMTYITGLTKTRILRERERESRV